MTKKKRMLSEDAAFEVALRDHPDWARAMKKDRLPEEVLGENGELMSPQLHLQLHAVVERQIAADDPKGVAEIARELEQLGVSRHDIRHAIGSVATGSIWRVTKEMRPFDAGRYLADLRTLVESYRR